MAETTQTGATIIKSDGTESTFPRCAIELQPRNLIVRTTDGDIVATFGLGWRRATDATKALHNHSPAPSWMDHRKAAMRGLYLCEDCGAELSAPASGVQLCGACEELAS